ncbi:TetR/AcrR family transcriptional regulator [Streptomyces violaceorubidus]
MPTGVHLRDARRQLFDAAERVLLRDRPGWADQPGRDRRGGLRQRRPAPQALALRETVGTGTVADNLTNALTSLFGPVPVAIIPLVTFRDELRARLREAVPGGGIAILAQVASAVSAYLTDERARARISADADIDSLTLSLVGGGHLLFADRDPGPPSTATVGQLVNTVLADVVRRRPH